MTAKETIVTMNAKQFLDWGMCMYVCVCGLSELVVVVVVEVALVERDRFDGWHEEPPHDQLSAARYLHSQTPLQGHVHQQPRYSPQQPQQLCIDETNIFRTCTIGDLRISFYLFYLPAKEPETRGQPDRQPTAPCR